MKRAMQPVHTVHDQTGGSSTTPPFPTLPWSQRRGSDQLEAHWQKSTKEKFVFNQTSELAG